MMKTAWCVLLVIGFLLLPQLGQSAVLVYESFDEADPTQLAGTTADIGLDAWTQISGVAASATVTSPGFTYSPMEVEGNKLTISTGAALYANLTNPFVTPPNSIRHIWGSFIMETSNTAGDAALSLFQVSNPTASTAALASIGLINSGDARLISGREMEGNVGNNGLATADVPVTQTNLYVFKITIDTNPGAVESGQFWINPTLTSGMTESDLGTGWSANFNNTGLSGVAALGLYTTGSNAASFDEIRLGTTLGSVTGVPVIPEPGSMALLLLGLAGVRMFRRFKS